MFVYLSLVIFLNKKKKEIKLDTYIRLLGGLRSKRYVLVVENNIVKKSFEEFDGVSLTCSTFHNVIKHLD